MRGLGFLRGCLEQNKRPALALRECLRDSPDQSPPSLARFPFGKDKNRPQDPLVLCVAGCTTGSLCPWYPYLRDKVLSLYLITRALSFLVGNITRRQDKVCALTHQNTPKSTKYRVCGAFLPYMYCITVV